MYDLCMIYENHGKSPTIMENPHDLQNISPSAQVRVSRFYQTTLLQLRAPDLSGHCRTSTETWHAWTRTHGRECQTVRIYVRWNARTPEWMPERMSNYIIFQGFFSTRSFQSFPSPVRCVSVDQFTMAMVSTKNLCPQKVVEVKPIQPIPTCPWMKKNPQPPLVTGKFWSWSRNILKPMLFWGHQSYLMMI